MDSIAASIERVTGNDQMLSVYNGSSEAIAELCSHFELRNVAVETRAAPDIPDGFCVLHADGRVLATSPLTDVRRAIGFDPAAFAPGFDHETPDVLRHAETTTFVSYDKRRMILASREIEERAWRTGSGQLYAGFQRLSRLRPQWSVYEKLTGSLDVRVYGVRDWEPPSDIVIDDGDDEEVRQSWFVVYDGAGADGHKAALVAEEREAGEYTGFWTYETEIVDELLAYFEAR